MQIAVIHNFDSATRFDLLMQEFKSQKIRDFKGWYTRGTYDEDYQHSINEDENI